MAMIKCPECGKDVSDSAFKCPSCGVALRKPRRGFMGKLFKWSFIAFNLLMLLWFITGMNNASQGMSGLSGAEQAGAAIATGIGAMLVLSIWVIGDIILGLFVLFTRPKTS